ncbi:unnamed protein product [Moneuplotes crassus]|uniref:Uncharacterized protein n=1 Tax=Euplotes crassus TaxID=5936 RepID=A0AAD1X6K1_EUPCR|nr:unnamed protein product [Moneuplotes crassus]
MSQNKDSIAQDLEELRKYKINSISQRKLPSVEKPRDKQMAVELEEEVINLESSLKRISSSYALFCKKEKKESKLRLNPPAGASLAAHFQK